MTYWRQAGLSYLKFSAICAQHVRAAIKKEFKMDLSQRLPIKQTLWKEGKPLKAGEV
ncbi:unnamed protein product [Larinioides sclopetarius]|uniref:ATP synthase F1 subunit epsilon n=1 Tax=Larinioides sclopetarius TaxID=280406 RepID=A0AAV2A3D2_9ARAC